MGRSKQARQQSRQHGRQPANRDGRGNGRRMNRGNDGRMDRTSDAIGPDRIEFYHNVPIEIAKKFAKCAGIDKDAHVRVQYFEFAPENVFIIDEEQLKYEMCSMETHLAAYKACTLYALIGRCVKICNLPLMGIIQPDMNIEVCGIMRHIEIIEMVSIMWFYDTFIRGHEVLPEGCTMNDVKSFSFPQLFQMYKTKEYDSVWSVIAEAQNSCFQDIIVEKDKFLVNVLLGAAYCSHHAGVFGYKDTIPKVQVLNRDWCTQHLIGSKKREDQVKYVAHMRFFSMLVVPNNITRSNLSISDSFVDDFDNVMDLFEEVQEERSTKLKESLGVAELCKIYPQMRPSNSDSLHSAEYNRIRQGIFDDSDFDFLTLACKRAIRSFIKGFHILNNFTMVEPCSHHWFSGKAVDGTDGKIIDEFIRNFEAENIFSLCDAITKASYEKNIEWGMPHGDTFVDVVMFLQNGELFRLICRVYKAHKKIDPKIVEVLSKISADCCELLGWLEQTEKAFKSGWPIVRKM